MPLLVIGEWHLVRFGFGRSEIERNEEESKRKMKKDGNNNNSQDAKR